MIETTYGSGGYNPAAPNGGIVAVAEVPNPNIRLGLRNIAIADSAALTAALADLRAGDVLTLADGVYPGSYAVNIHGNEADPIIIRAANPLGVQLTGTLALNRSYCFVVGFNLGSSGRVQAVGTGGTPRGERNKILGCKATGGGGVGGSVAFVSGASHNEVLFCEFDSQLGYGVQVRLNDDADSPRTTNNRIAFCWFHDFPIPEVNGSEPVQIGQGTRSTAWNVKTIVEFNLIERCLRDDELISLKSAGNIVRYNHLVDATRTGDGCWLSLRHGSLNDVVGNLLDNTRGIRVHGDDHKVLSNKLVGGKIELVAGNATQDTQVEGDWPAARNVVVVGNNCGGGDIYVGAPTSGGSGPTTATATNNRVIGNMNANVILGTQSGTDQATAYTGITYAPTLGWAGSFSLTEFIGRLATG